MSPTVECTASSFGWPNERLLAEAAKYSQSWTHEDVSDLQTDMEQMLKDFIVSLPAIRGCDRVYVVVSTQCSYAHSCARLNSVLTKGVAQLFIDNLWELHCWPESLNTERRPKFASALCSELCNGFSSSV